MSVKNERTRRRAINNAIQAAGGSLRSLGEMVDPPVTPQAVHQWVTSNCIPAYRVIQVEKATGVPRHQLSPELYPSE